MLLALPSNTYPTFHFIHHYQFPPLSLTLTTAVAPVSLLPPLPFLVIFNSADRVLLLKNKTAHVRILPSHLHKGQTLTVASRSYVSAPHRPLITSDPISYSSPHPPPIPATLASMICPTRHIPASEPWHLLSSPAWPVLSPCCTQLAFYLLQVIN